MTIPSDSSGRPGSDAPDREWLEPRPTARILRNDLISLVTLIAFVMLVGSYYAADSKPWLSNVLLQFGSALIVVVPFLLLTRYIESQLQSSNSETRAALTETRNAVESLGQDVARIEMARDSVEIDEIIRDRLADDHKPDQDLFESLAKNPSREDFILALNRAAELKIIASFGVRVRLSEFGDLYLWFRPGEDDSAGRFDRLRVVAQRWNVNVVCTKSWLPGVGFPDLMLDMAANLRKTRHWRGDSSFRPAESIANLSKLLLRGLEEAVKEADTEVFAEIFEWSEHTKWLICESDLSYDDRRIPYHVSYRDLGQADWEEHIAGKLWANGSNFREAYDVALCLVADHIAEGKLPPGTSGVWQHRSQEEQG